MSLVPLQGISDANAMSNARSYGAACLAEALAAIAKAFWRATSSVNSGSFHRPRLLSDNGSSYGQDVDHVRGALYHPMAQGEIERWHQTPKKRILLETFPCPFRDR